jgi:hypothetical protein
LAYRDIHKQDLSKDFMDFKKVNEDVDKKQVKLHLKKENHIA